MKRIQIGETIKHIGKKALLAGWINIRRDHGKIIFVDLRDRSGLIQLVFTPKNKELYQLAEKLRPEWVVKVEGQINERPEKMVNPNIDTGKVEMLVEKLEVLNESITPPFEITEEGEIAEELRLKYRYLDLRRKRVKENMVFRYQIIKFIRDFLDKKSFLEIETPILTKSTPEGARDFLIPARLHPGEFYALPQAPQQLKQLLMIAGFEKYFQIAHCFRDEDSRGDRQPEFTQLDLEMSFVNQEDVRAVIEELIIEIVELMNKPAQGWSASGRKKLTFNPLKVLTYDEAIKKYKTDSPDLRKDKKDPNELCFVWIVDWPLFEWDREAKRWDPMHHVFTSPREEDIKLLDKDPAKTRSRQYDLVCNGYEIGGGSIRNSNLDVQKKIFELVGLKKDEINEKFGHLLRAFEYGTPPHGGIALGVERLLMILRNEPNIREVMAFPKTGDGKDLMMEAPNKVTKKQLKELNIKIDK